MKLRSVLLVACIVVVPLIAMFSHRIPPAARTAATRWLRDACLGTRPAGQAVARAPAVAPPAPLPNPAPGRTIPTAADEPRVVPVTAQVPPDAAQPASLARLRELGAVAIDCRALPAPGGHIASCRLPVDGAGQLERVFQATGADEAAAAAQLLRDVDAWRRGSRVAAPRTLRF